jgi:glycosyltransferase involved in cell wall biosynthesis
MSGEAEPTPRAAALYVDIDELLRHALSGGHTTGIFRVMQELCTALDRRGARFLRHASGGLDFVEVEWSAVAAALASKEARLQAARPTPKPRPQAQALPAAGAPPLAGWRVLLRRYLRWLSPQVSVAVQMMLGGMKMTLRGLRALPGAMAAARRHPVAVAMPAAVAPPRRSVAEPGFAPIAGDVVFAPGAPWEDPAFAARIGRWRQRGGRFALLVHDIIPIMRPQWSDAGHNRYFRQWFESTAAQADVLLAISRATAGDMARHAACHGVAIVAPVVVPMGTGFRDPPPPPQPSRLPEPGSYVLLVSSIETRKNHIVAFRVWQVLLETMPAGSVPLLLLAGRPSYQSEDFMAQLANSNRLDGHIRHIADASDAELAALYRGCRFSLYPSLYEGWGLPVTESLHFGRPCLAANLTSLPEAGGDMARYFDPDDLADAVRVIRQAIEQPDEMEALARRIATQFRAASWDDMAAAVWAAGAMAAAGFGAAGSREAGA